MKRIRSLSVQTRLLAACCVVLPFAAVLWACEGGSSPTAPEAPSPLPPPTKSLFYEANELGTQGVGLEVAEKAKGPKVDVCHQKGNGSYDIVNVAESAVAAHERHGDWRVTDEVCDGLDNDCNGIVDDGGDGLCDDGVGCTVDLCNGEAGCSNTPDDLVCDDGLFCNGEEICDVSADCVAGSDPCEGGVCDEDGDVCGPPAPTVECWPGGAADIVAGFATQVPWWPTERSGNTKSECELEIDRFEAELVLREEETNGNIVASASCDFEVGHGGRCGGRGVDPAFRLSGRLSSLEEYELCLSWFREIYRGPCRP